MSNKTMALLDECDLNKDLDQKNAEPTTRSPSDDFFLNQKKLKEAETQLRSLCLILKEQHSGKCDGIDYVALKESKTVLENKIHQLRDRVSNDEARLGNDDMLKSMIDGNHEKGRTANKGELVEELDRRNVIFSANVSYEDSGITGNTTERFSETQEFPENSILTEHDVVINADEGAEFLRDENVRLRRKLSEAQLKQKSERDSVMEQLRVLEVETIDGEKHWASEIQAKQVELEKCVSDNRELMRKNEELLASLEERETQREKDSKEWESKVKKKQELISKLKTSLVNAKAEKKVLEKALNEARGKSKTIVKDLARELHQKLCDKNETIERTNATLEKYVEELKEARYKIEILQREVECLKQEKEHLKAELQSSKDILGCEKRNITALNNERKLAEATAQCFIEVSLRSVEESQRIDDNLQKVTLDLREEVKLNKHLEKQLKKVNSYVKTLEKDKLSSDVKTMELKQKLLMKESTIHALTISLGQTIKKTEESTLCELKRICEFRGDNDNTTVKKYSLEAMQKIMVDIREELTGIKEDVIRHKENVDTLGDKWRRYKSCLKEIRQDFTKTL